MAKDTKDTGLTSGGNDLEKLEMTACVDANYAVCTGIRRSVSRATVLPAKATISYFSRTQAVTAVTSTESGCIAKTGGAKHVIFLGQVAPIIMPNVEKYSGPVMEGNKSNEVG